jgi:hypothetical protein
MPVVSNGLGLLMLYSGWWDVVQIIGLWNSRRSWRCRLLFSFNRQLQIRQSAPRALCEVHAPVTVTYDSKAVMIHGVAHLCIELIHALAAGPVQRLTRVVLIISRFADTSDLDQRLWKIRHDPAPHGKVFPVLVVNW